MTLFIACLLIHHMNLPGWWYAIAVGIWLLAPGDGFGHLRLRKIFE